MSKSKQRLQSASATRYTKENTLNSRSLGIMSETKFHDNTYRVGTILFDFIFLIE
jgi:hypothetical protein